VGRVLFRDAVTPGSSAGRVVAQVPAAGPGMVKHAGGSVNLVFEGTLMDLAPTWAAKGL